MLSQVSVLGKKIEHNREEIEIAEQEIESAVDKKEIITSGKLIVAEEIAKGHITWKSFNLYLSALAGDYPLVFFSVFLGGFVALSCANSFQAWFLGYWGSQYENHSPQDVSIPL